MNTRNGAFIPGQQDMYFDGISTRNSNIKPVAQINPTLQPGWINKVDKTKKVRKWTKMKVPVGNYFVQRYVPIDKIPEIEEKMRLKLEMVKELKNAQQIDLVNQQTQQNQQNQAQQHNMQVAQNFMNQNQQPQQSQQQNFIPQQQIQQQNSQQQQQMSIQLTNLKMNITPK
eukprot:gene7245-11563_t